MVNDDNKNKIVPVTYRTTTKRKEIMIDVILRTKPKYRSINHFIDTAIDLLTNEEVAAITRKEVYQHDKSKRDRTDNLDNSAESNSNNRSKESFNEYWADRLEE